MRRIAIYAALALPLAMGACGQDDNPIGTQERGQTARVGSCQASDGTTYCGGKSGAPNANCFCDEACADWGDCCSDIQPVCEGAATTTTGIAGLPACQVEGACTPVEAAVQKVYATAFYDDGQIDEAEAWQLAAFLKDGQGQDPRAEAMLANVVADATSPLTDAARARLSGLVDGETPNWIPLDNEVYALVPGNTPTMVMDDAMHLRATGQKIVGHTNVTGHSRGYAKKADGPLRKAHGSPAPAYPNVASAEETELLRSQGPHRALDEAAAIYGVDLGSVTFTYLAEDVHYDPNAQYWEGLCHAWSYTSLDERLNALVEVDGAPGRRGVWIFGQWISRADLGNWLMGAANQTSVTDAQLIDNFVEPEDLLKGFAQWVMTSGRGLRADLFSDVEDGASEIWNQPIFDGALELEATTPAVTEAIVAHMVADEDNWHPVPESPAVYVATLDASWGVETSDDWEQEVALKTSHWVMYLVVDAADDNRVVKGYMAHHLPTIPGLPYTHSSALPDYFAHPNHAAVDASLGQEPLNFIDGGFEGKIYRFYVGTVLPYGVPDTLRQGFEEAFFAQAYESVDELKRRFPGIANAYRPEQWATIFEPTLGPGSAFGAVWGQGG